MTIISLRDVSAGYGKQIVLQGVSLDLAEGEAISVLGANGAGKTTLMKLMAGFIRSRSGGLSIDGREQRGRKPHQRLRQGVSLVAEGHQVVGTLSIEENLYLGALRFYPRESRRQLAGRMDEVYEMFPALAERRGIMAALLSGGQQQMLAIGRSFMSRPRVLLLDEPSLGLAPVVVDDIYQQLHELKTSRALSMVIVEQSPERCIGLCDRHYLLRLGEIVGEADPSGFSPEELRAGYFA